MGDRGIPGLEGDIENERESSLFLEGTIEPLRVSVHLGTPGVGPAVGNADSGAALIVLGSKLRPIVCEDTDDRHPQEELHPPEEIPCLPGGVRAVGPGHGKSGRMVKGGDDKGLLPLMLEDDGIHAHEITGQLCRELLGETFLLPSPPPPCNPEPRRSGEMKAGNDLADRRMPNGDSVLLEEDSELLRAVVGKGCPKGNDSLDDHRRGGHPPDGLRTATVLLQRAQSAVPCPETLLPEEEGGPTDRESILRRGESVLFPEREYHGPTLGLRRSCHEAQRTVGEPPKSTEPTTNEYPPHTDGRVRR